MLLVLLSHAWALDEGEWLLEAATLPAKERVALVEKALGTYARNHCSLLLGAMLSGDDEIKPLLPAIQRNLCLLIQPEDADSLAEKIEKVQDAVLADWLVDMIGFCGEKGFAKLRQLRAESKDERIRLGALRAMANLMIPEAVQYVADVAAKTKSPVERDIAHFAERRLRWQTGQADRPDKSDAVPLVSLNKGEKAVREALAAGGTLVIAPGELTSEAQAILRELAVEPPSRLEKLASQNCIFSVPDFHPLFAYPNDFFYRETASTSFAAYAWGEWQPGQLAPLRPAEKPDRAAVVVQEGVLGKGRVVFSGLIGHSWGQTAKYRVAERDAWEENTEAYHAAKDVPAYFHVWQARDGGFVSQHVPYGKPLAGGAIKAVILTPDYNGRDAVEFAQRLEMEWEHLPYAWAPKKGEAFAVQAGRLSPLSWLIVERLLAGPRDVIVLSGRVQIGLRGGGGAETFSLLPTDYQQLLLRLVRDKGLGLVITGEQGPIPMLPPDAHKETVNGRFGPISRAEWGKGRIVCMGRPGELPANYRIEGAFRPLVRLNPYDYWAADVVAQIAWAAHRELPFQITTPPSVEAEVLQLPAKNSSNQPLDALLHVQFRAPHGHVAAEKKLKIQLPPGQESKLRMPTDGLGAGHFFAELVARDDKGRSLGWGAFPVRLEGPVEITGIGFDKPLYRPGEEMVVALTVAGKVPAGLQADAEVVDLYGRLCGVAAGPVEHATPEGSGPRSNDARSSLSVRVKVGRPLWRYVTVRVCLRDKDRVLSRWERPWIVDVPPPQKDYPYAAWSSLPTSPPLTPAAHAAGIDWMNTDFERCLENGLRPWVIGFGGLGLGEHAAWMNYERNPCTMGPTFHQWRLLEIPPQVKDIRRADVAAIIDQDEEGLGGEYGFHPAELHEFRKYMKVVHRSLDELNRIWETSFKDWNEVMPMRLAQVRDRRSLAPMVELRMFMDTAYLHHCEFDRFVLESNGLSDVKLGLSTSGGGFSDGWDIWKAAKMLTCQIEQGTNNREKFYSWARPDMVLGRWTGGYYPDCISSGHFMPWLELTHGKTVYATWEGGLGGDMSLWRPDGRPRDGIAVAAQELREIWTGPATMIRHSTRIPPQIGIHYSRASQMANVAEWGWASWAEMDMLENALEILGHQYRYISYEELEQGFLDTWPGKCLFLPASTCLSKREVEALRRFVERGGTLVADCDPGTRDGHGGAAGRGQLADVFGCEWVPAPAALAQAPNPKKPPEAGVSFPVALIELPGAPEGMGIRHTYARVAKLTTGKPRGKMRMADLELPVWIEHEFGKGKAITLNFLPHASGADLWVVRTLVAAAGVTFPVSVRKDGSELPAVERSSYQDGPVQYTAIVNFVKLRSGWGQLALTPEEQKPVPGVAVTFPVKAHLYDVRAKKYLGETDRVTLDINPGRYYFFAHLPYKVDGLSIGLPEVSGAKGAARIDIQVDAAKRPLAPHAVRVQLFEPGGREREEYGSVLYLPAGKGQIEVPFAANDPPGKWRVIATEAASGLKAEKEWEVKP